MLVVKTMSENFKMEFVRRYKYRSIMAYILVIIIRKREEDVNK